MNNYIGKTCPFCKTRFVEGDDIVVCSSCEMPHHKDCWIENQGCTTFGCMGTINSVDGQPNSVTTTTNTYYTASPVPPMQYVFCTRCGTRSDATAAFCVKCGNKLTKPF